MRGVGWLTDWLGALLAHDGVALSPIQTEALSQAAKANAGSDPFLQTMAHFRSQLGFGGR